MTNNRAASIHAKLRNIARDRQEDFNLLLNRYGTERFLYRLSISPHAGLFMLKGALLFGIWFPAPHRPTRDADFLGFGPADEDNLRTVMNAISAIDNDDGLVFDANSTTIEDTRARSRYDGFRVRMVAMLGKARITIQLDIGYGDAVTPKGESMTLPGILPELTAPTLQVYPRETVIAEKLEAIASLGMVNSRLKDYFDLYALAQEGAVEADFLATAIAATFHRRGTVLPIGHPLGLTATFSSDPTRIALWKAFLRKNQLLAPSLIDVVTTVATFLEEPIRMARDKQ